MKDQLCSLETVQLVAAATGTLPEDILGRGPRCMKTLSGIFETSPHKIRNDESALVARAVLAGSLVHTLCRAEIDQLIRIDPGFADTLLASLRELASITKERMTRCEDAIGKAAQTCTV